MTRLEQLQSAVAAQDGGLVVELVELWRYTMQDGPGKADLSPIAKGPLFEALGTLRFHTKAGRWAEVRTALQQVEANV